MRSKEVIISALILSVLLVVSGVDQCPQSIGGIGGTTEASKYGVDFAVQSGLDKLSDGKTIIVGDSFFIDVLIENFDSEPKSGEICIRDEIGDEYGGVPTTCRQFNIPAATYLGDVLQSPASINVAFPDSGNYKYENLPIDANSKLYVSISYTQRSTASAAIKVPVPQTETITFQQKSSPIAVTADKTVSSRDDNMKVNLKIGLTKQGNYNITSTDFKRESIGISTNFGSYNLDCPEVQQGFIDFKSTKFISCSALLPREQISYPLLIYLDYGVKLSKELSFNIKKQL
jgi:hypothetical protein